MKNLTSISLHKCPRNTEIYKLNYQIIINPYSKIFNRRAYSNPEHALRLEIFEKMPIISLYCSTFRRQKYVFFTQSLVKNRMRVFLASKRK